MTAIILHKSRISLSPSDIEHFEFRNEISLPENYKEFLLVHNGGKPDHKIFPIQNNPSDSHAYVEFFFCISEKDIYDLGVWIRRYHHRIPAQIIPIAIDPGGNLICLTISGNNVNKLFYWDHESEVENGKEPWNKNLYFIANNLQEFISSLA